MWGFWKREKEEIICGKVWEIGRGGIGLGGEEYYIGLDFGKM